MVIGGRNEADYYAHAEKNKEYRTYGETILGANEKDSYYMQKGCAKNWQIHVGIKLHSYKKIRRGGVRMKKLVLILSLVFLLCFAFGCQKNEEVAAEPVVDVEADTEAVRNWVKESYAAADSGDVEDYMSFWAEDVIWMPPNAQIIQGTSAIREMLQPYFEQLTTHREISVEEIEVADDLAFIRINSDEKYTHIKGEGESIEASFKAIIILQRMADGTWLGIHYIWNSNDPLPNSEEN